VAHHLEQFYDQFNTSVYQHIDYIFQLSITGFIRNFDFVFYDEYLQVFKSLNFKLCAESEFYIRREVYCFTV